MCRITCAALEDLALEKREASGLGASQGFAGGAFRCVLMPRVVLSGVEVLGLRVAGRGVDSEVEGRVGICNLRESLGLTFKTRQFGRVV